MRSTFPEVVANEVLDELKIYSPEDLLLLDQIAYARGAIVREDRLAGAEARITYLPGNSVITVSSLISSPERRRFSVCHELGHLEMHRGLFLCSETDIGDQISGQAENQEGQANQFASAFLLPARLVGNIFAKNVPTFDLIKEISRDFQMSLTATALRMTRFSREPVAVVYSEAGRISWFEGTDDFHSLEIFVDVRAPVNSMTNAGRLFDGKEIREGCREVPAKYWLKEGRYRADATIKESSLHMPNYNSVLTLLWVDEIIDHEELIV